MRQPAKTPDPDDRGPGGKPSRERVLNAVAEALFEDGYSRLTIERAVEIAGMSSADFYAVFADESEAVEAAIDAALERFETLLTRACAAQESWPLKVKVAIGASLDFAAAAPAQAALLDLSGVRAARPVALRSAGLKDRLASVLAAGRRYSKDGAALPALTEQALVAGMAATVSTRLQRGEAKRLPELAPELVQIALLPYLGGAEAARVATRPRPGSAA